MSNQNNTKKPTILIFPGSVYDLIKSINRPSTSKILSQRKTHFTQEYLKLNNISMSTTCYVKLSYNYAYGHLTINNSKLTINQYESNKMPNKLNDNSFYYNRTIMPLITLNDNINNKNDKSTEDILYPLFFIDFNLTTCQLVIHKTKQKFRLIILGKNIKDNDYDDDDDYITTLRVVKFKMTEEQKEIFNLVCEAINKSIILSNGYRNNIFSINIRHNFCKEYFMNCKEFASKANTGDILLFKGYAKESKVQRIITNADYDHVAILVKKDGILQVYESTGKEGVQLRPWHEFITFLWYLLYDKMSFRALQATEEAMKTYVTEEINKDLDINEKPNNIDDLNAKEIKEKFYYYLNKKVLDFIERTKEKKYAFSKRGFLCVSSMRKNPVDRKGYSCSELVAVCYYHSGLISDTLEASNYLPGSFSRAGKVAFKPGFYLGEEFIIDFSTSSYS